MSEAELAQFSDTELLAAYQEALSQNQAESAAAGQAITLPVDSLKDLTPQQVRSLLLEAGISQEALDKVSDQELLDLVKETVSGY